MGFLTNIFGTDEFTSLIDKVDTVVDKLPNIVDNDNSETIAANAIKEYINSFGGNDKKSQDESEFNGLIQGLTVSQERLNRYNTYDEIFRSVQLIKRIINVYIPNILQQDLITNRLIIFKKNEDTLKESATDDVHYNNAHKFITDLFEYYNIEKNLRNRVVPSFLRYGDFFIRIIDLDKLNIEYPITKTDVQLYATKDNQIITEDSETIANYLFDNYVSIETSNLITEDNDISANAEDESQNEDDIEILTNYNFNKVTFQYIKPHNIIILKPKDAQMIFGYLYVRDESEFGNATETINPTMQMASVLNQISGVVKGSKTKLDDVLDKLTHKIVKSILTNEDIKRCVENTVDNPKISVDDMLKSCVDENVYYTIKELFFTTQDYSFRKTVKVEFIPANQIVHFQIPSSEYDPYGGSIIDPLVYPAKLYLMNQLANTVMKLSRASVIRKWIVESGPRDINSTLLQQLKREFRNQRITSSDILSMKTIPRVLSDFKDLVVFSKKGQRFVDVEVNPIGDPNSKVTDLEDARRELISLSGVPAAYLGHADIADLREGLINVNISFANEIVQLQNIITTGLTELVDKVASIYNMNVKPSKVIKPSITPPVVLMLQLLESTISSIGNIFQTFQSIDGVDADPYYLLERYLPYIEWPSFKEAAEKFKVFQKTNVNDEDEQ